MKLVRQTTSDLDRSDKESSITGRVRASDLMRGNKHYFLIQNASPAELEAIDDLLRETEFADCCDACPVYGDEDADGWSCGWWVDIEDVDAFKAEYKRLKGYVADRVIKNASGIDVDAAHAEALAMEAARQLNARQARFVFHNTAAERAQAINDAHDEALELNNVFRKAKARFDHFWGAYSYYQRREKIEVAHVKALEINRETPMFSQAADLLSERITNNNNEPLTEGETLQIAFYTKLNSAMREQAIADAYTQARLFNRLIDNADLLPEFWTKYNLIPADVDYIIAVSQRLNPELWASDLESAHILALEENDDFDGIIRDGLTPEQRAIHNSRMGIDIYGEHFKAMLEADHVEALEFNELLDESLITLCDDRCQSNFAALNAHSKMLLVNACHDEALFVSGVINDLLEIEVPVKPAIEFAFDWMIEHDKAHVEALKMDEEYNAACRDEPQRAANRHIIVAGTPPEPESQGEAIAPTIYRAKRRAGTWINDLMVMGGVCYQRQGDSVPHVEAATFYLQPLVTQQFITDHVDAFEIVTGTPVVDFTRRIDWLLFETPESFLAGLLPEPTEPMTIFDVAIERFQEVMPTQYPDTTDVRLNEDLVDARANEAGKEWVEIYRGQYAEDVIVQVILWIQGEMRYHMDMQKLEIAADRGAEERYSDAYYNGENN